VTVGQRKIIEQAVKRITDHRHLLGHDVVELSVGILQQKLAALSRPPLNSHPLPHLVPEEQHHQNHHLAVLVAGLADKSGEPIKQPEAVNRAWLDLEKIVRHWGGILIQQPGNKRVALFGLDNEETAPERAVRAALIMQAELALRSGQRDRLTADRTPYLPGLQMQVGLHWGSVTADLQNGHLISDLSDSTVHMAEQLQEMAPAGTPLLSHQMYQAVGQYFEVEPNVLPELSYEEQSVTGLQRAAYLARDDKTPDFWQHLRSSGMVPHLIGREAESTLLQQQLEQVVQQQQAHMVTVLGGLGLGKSHLLYHFEQWLNLAPMSVLLLRGRVRPGSWSWPTPPLGDLLADLCGLRLYDSNQVLRNKIDIGLQRYLPETTVSEAAAVVQGWFGLRSTDTVSYNPAQWLLVLVRLLRAIVRQGESGQSQVEPPIGSGRQPTVRRRPAEAVVLLLEDLHEADELSLNFIEALFRQCHGLPLLLIGSARPSLRTKRSSWPTAVPASQHTLLKLPPISAIDARHLVSAFLPRTLPPPLKLYELLVAGTKRTPLYIREAIRLLELEGRLEPGQTLRPASHLGATSLAHINPNARQEKLSGLLPDSLPDIFRHQLTAVSDTARTVLQRAAVVGQLFWESAVAYLDESAADKNKQSELTAVLQSLVAAGFIRRQPFPVYGWGQAYTFSHSLLRQIVNEQISPQQRHYYQMQLEKWQQHRVQVQTAVQLPDVAAYLTNDNKASSTSSG
jgi:hypothetical protein